MNVINLPGKNKLGINLERRQEIRYEMEFSEHARMIFLVELPIFMNE